MDSLLAKPIRWRKCHRDEQVWLVQNQWRKRLREDRKAMTSESYQGLRIVDPPVGAFVALVAPPVGAFVAPPVGAFVAPPVGPFVAPPVGAFVAPPVGADGILDG